jgi:hypothetical protein
MTFLEFVIRKLLGAPIRRDWAGCAYWYCPLCGKPKLHCLPHGPEKYKDRWKCWACFDFRGDEFDILKHFVKSFERRLQIIDGWRAEWLRLFPPGNPRTLEQLVDWMREKINDALEGKDPSCDCVWSHEWFRRKLSQHPGLQHPESVQQCWQQMAASRNGRA